MTIKGRNADVELARCFLVSCVSEKRDAPAKAKDLYKSALFTKARAFVEKAGGAWFILSAKHGLVHPEATINPYNETLNSMGTALRRAWAKRVIVQMELELPRTDEIVVLAGQRYREYLMDYLTTRARISVPLEGLRIGEQLSWLSRQ